MLIDFPTKFVAVSISSFCFMLIFTDFALKEEVIIIAVVESRASVIDKSI